MKIVQILTPWAFCTHTKFLPIAKLTSLYILVICIIYFIFDFQDLYLCEYVNFIENNYIFDTSS